MILEPIAGHFQIVCKRVFRPLSGIAVLYHLGFVGAGLFGI